MRLRQTDDDEGSLDSLLDTMTNVVGILVIVLVVTQLGVKEAVERIGDAVDLEEMAATQEALQRESARREELLAVVENVSLPTIDDPAAELRKVEQQIEAARRRLEANQQEALAREEQLENQTEAIEKLNEREKEIRDKLEAALTRKAELDALLEETPKPRAKGTPKAKVVNLPNPRPAPKGAAGALILCRGERLYLLNLPEVRKTAQQRAEQIIRSRRLDRDPEAGIDPEKFATAFNDKKVITEHFRVGITVRNGRRPWLVFERRENHGQTVSALRRRSSVYQRALRTLDPKKYYAQFLVWPDSFEIYLAARNVATEIGLLAGWNPQTTTEEYQAPLGGPLALGPPPKPKPAPKTPPKPAPKPARPVPVDTID